MNKTVPAARCARVLSNSDGKKPVARMERSAIRVSLDASAQLPDFTSFHPGYKRKKKEAERRQTQCFMSRTQAVCGAHQRKIGLRRPPLAGALACRRSTTALAKESISSPRRDPGHASWVRVLHGLCPPSPAHLQRCTPHAGHNAGRLMPGPPECAADEATPAGTALAPLRPASPGRRPSRASSDSLNCNRNGDRCQ
jgi:hypothetical protein